jgi:hypothetical protein
MSRSLKITFLVHAIVAFILGLALLAAPGRTLGFFDWSPIDPIASRFLGAALLAMAWSSLRGYLADSWDQVELLVEFETAFTVLAATGLIRHLLVGSWPWFPWAIFIITVLFAIVWIYQLVTHNKND